MKTNNTKILAASMSLLTSIQAFAGLGGLNVQSNLGEPFSGSIVVTGSEAQALLKSGRVSVSGGGVHGTVVSQPNGNALIRLRSASAVTDPVLTFTVKAGNQTRQYSAMVNPSRYTPAQPVQRAAEPVRTVPAPVPVVPRREAAVNTPPVSKAAAPVQGVRPRVEKTQPAAAERGSRQAAAKPRTRNQPTPRPEPMPQRDSNSQYHQVQPGEHLAAIAEKYRPHNMTLQQAMRALVRANPRAFRNGNPHGLYSNATLYIPTDAQWHAYANGKGSRRNAVRTPVVPAVSPQPQQPVTAQTPPAAHTPAAPPQASVPVEPVQTPPAVQTPASKPETATPASLAVPPASIPASAVVPAASGAVSAAVLPPEPVSEPVPQPQPQPPAEPVQEGETDWMQYGLMGLGGLAALGGAAYLLGRRRRDDGAAAADEDSGEQFEAQSVAVPTAAAAAQRVKWSNQADEVVLNDQDDEVFFNDSANLGAAAEEARAAKEFNLDDFEPEPQTVSAEPAAAETFDDFDQDWQTAAAGLGAGAAAAAGLAANAQAASFAGAAEDDFVVADADGEQWLQEMAELERQEALKAEAPVEAEVSFDDDFGTGDFAAADVTARSEPAAGAGVLDDFDFSLDEPADTAAAEFAAGDAAFGSRSDDAFAAEAEADFPVSFDADPAIGAELAADDFATGPAAGLGAADFALDTPESPLAAGTAETLAPDLDFALPDTAGGDDAAMDFVLDDGLSAAGTFDLGQPETAVSAAGDEALDFALDDVAAAPLAETALDMPALEADAGSFDALAADFDEPAAVQADKGLVQTGAAFAAEPEPFVAPASDVGFVTGAVGMEAPLEAKLELAKMYLEIDDAVAARETLRELINESSGDVQAQAKALLTELGG